MSKLSAVLRTKTGAAAVAAAAASIGGYASGQLDTGAAVTLFANSVFAFFLRHALSKGGVIQNAEPAREVGGSSA